MPDRGSGRTTRQLAALPDGSAYLVHSHKFADYCRHILRGMGRQPTAIRFFIAEQPPRVFEGLRFREWDVDHACFELARHGVRQSYDMMSMAAGRGPGGTK